MLSLDSVSARSCSWLRLFLPRRLLGLPHLQKLRELRFLNKGSVRCAAFGPFRVPLLRVTRFLPLNAYLVTEPPLISGKHPATPSLSPTATFKSPSNTALIAGVFTATALFQSSLTRSVRGYAMIQPARLRRSLRNPLTRPFFRSLREPLIRPSFRSLRSPNNRYTKKGSIAPCVTSATA